VNVISSDRSHGVDVLELRSVRKAHLQDGRAEVVLEGASLQVGAGQVVAVVGERWEGKTTLLELAAGMELADAGQVLFDGRDLAGMSRRRRARLLGHDIVWLDRSNPDLRLTTLDYIALPRSMGWRARAARSCVAWLSSH
jgi:predicted ABC-type transport system involved in lysophospholipase L1 biosynthesis ATPase subunit